ncbi:ecto-ADP-ribosyltransferase 5-like [Betta splendens]|uniref:NAD(P)(+)--arginine ADP-ribosyltransferase n=1 Tax=Betta splendens TaxID=158456 RepID=A0A6P7MBU0_BETSP|nr:ecto-ADP-ribosyltransferase 5-like [Betta splendens]
MAVMQLWAAVFITYGVATGIAQVCMSKEMNASATFPLDMAPQSVDDMYKGCNDSMNATANMYLLNETNMDKDFSQAWNKSEKAYWNKYEKIKSLEKDLFKAIHVYTLGDPKIYLDLNKAVRTQKSQYGTTFRYHALHFFLTRAIQTLNAEKPEEERCLTSYRRTSVSFSQDVLNKKFRFGSFTSSSQGDYPSGNFGKVSCFKIVTCFGADIQRYSALGKHEREVLIPPYEIFKVTKIITGTERNNKKNDWCSVVYKLQSTQTPRADLNC